MKKNLIYLLIALILVAVLVNTYFIFLYIRTNRSGLDEEDYSPVIISSEFTSKIDNSFFSLTPGKKMVYEADTSEGLERTEFYVTNETKIVNGVETIVVWDRVWLDGELIEDTKDWYTQDKDGNVWYFGEDSKEILNGNVVSTAGSWEFGRDGAKPGIIMKSNPIAGDSYRQEYYKGEAEDTANIISLNESVNVSYGYFIDCLKTLDYTPLELDVRENKYYCPEVGGVVLEIDLNSGERTELIDVEYNLEQSF